MKNILFELNIDKLDKVNGGSTTRVPSKFTAIRELRGSVASLVGPNPCHPGLWLDIDQRRLGRVEAPLF